MRISRRAAAAITLVVAGLTAGSAAYAVAQPGGAHGACHVSQVVYSSNDGQPVGTWSATLAPGQEVFEPDAMVATCLANGALDVTQP